VITPFLFNASWDVDLPGTKSNEQALLMVYVLATGRGTGPATSPVLLQNIRSLKPAASILRKGKLATIERLMLPGC